MLEFEAERRILHEFVPTLLSGIVRLHAWVFEFDAQASEDPSRKIWLPQLDTSALYIGILGKGYGEWTIDEFSRAAGHHIPKLMFIKKMNQDDREQKLNDFIKLISGTPTTGLNPVYFDNAEDLKQRVAVAIQNWILKRLSNKSRFELREALKKCNEDYLIWFDRNQKLADNQQEAFYRRIHAVNYLFDTYSDGLKDEPEHRRIIRIAIQACEDAEDTVDGDCKKCLEVDALSADWDSCYSRYKHNLTYIARRRLVPYFVTGQSTSEGSADKAGAEKMKTYHQRNLDALRDAIDRLKELI